MNLQIIMQILKSKNPQAMIQNLAKSNPNIAQAIPIAQQIMKSGGSKKEQLAKACKQSGANAEEVERQLSNFGISL